MNRTVGRTARDLDACDDWISRYLPAVWEVLRAVSGLVAILVLAGIMAGIALSGDTEAIEPSLAVQAVSSPPPSARDSFALLNAVSTPRHRMLVIYLVATPEQAEIADWGEQVDAMEVYKSGSAPPDRGYTILYAGSDEEEFLASQTILETLIALPETVLLDVIDLRSVRISEIDSTRH